MRRQVLLDTGPLVALLNRRDAYHAWAKTQWPDLQPPLLTCESVLSEACFLLRGVPGGSKAVMELLHRGSARIALTLQDEMEPVSRLLGRYSSVPMSLADACLVRMAEIYSGSQVFTLDSDFRLYRKHGRQVVPLIIPEM